MMSFAFRPKNKIKKLSIHVVCVIFCLWYYRETSLENVDGPKCYKDASRLSPSLQDSNCMVEPKMLDCYLMVLNQSNQKRKKKEKRKKEKKKESFEPIIS